MRSAIETEQNFARVANRPVMGQLDASSVDSGADGFNGVFQALLDAQKLKRTGEVHLPSALLTLEPDGVASATAPTITPKEAAANGRALTGSIGIDLSSEAVNAVSASAIVTAINAATTLAESTSAAPAADAAVAAIPAPPAAPPAAPLANAAVTGAVTSVAASPAAPAANVIAATATSNPMAAKFSLDSASQALTTITQNPAYAAIATSLYVSVAAYRPQDPSVMAVPDRSDTPKPPNGISALQEVDTERQETNYQRPRGGNRARAYLA